MKHGSHPEIPAFATFCENVICHGSAFPEGLKRTTRKPLPSEPSFEAQNPYPGKIRKDRIVVDAVVHNAKSFYCQALSGLKTISAPEGIMI
jgi:hypothetical protein